MLGWERSWVALVAVAAVGCGNTERDPRLAATAGAGGSSEAGAPSVNASAGSAAASSKPEPVIVDPAVSAKYVWTECGRIAPTGKPVAAAFTPDESVLVVEQSGAVRLYPNGSAIATTLLSRGASYLAPSAGLSPDGHWLLAGENPGLVHVYAAKDRAPLGASTESVEQVATLEWESEAYPGPLTFSSDSKLVIVEGLAGVIVWDADGGELRAKFAVAGEQVPSAVALRADVPAPLRVFRDNKLFQYTLEGDLRQTLDVSLPGPGLIEQAQFTPDARQLLVGFHAEQEPSLLLAFDAETGRELWRAVVLGASTFSIAPDSSVVQVHQGASLRLVDGNPVGTDPAGLRRRVAALGPGGTRELRLAEQVVEWDVQSGKLVGLYGAHTEAIRDLEVSADGRFLASHGQHATVWRLDADFAQSQPVFEGAAPDSSWNVALSADGQRLAVSGDNVALFRPDGTFVMPDVSPGAGAISCLSADWSFSPVGSWVAGTHYGSDVDVYSTSLLERKHSVSASNCGGGVAFSPDGSRMMTASLELFDTATWARLSPPGYPLEGGLGEDAVQFSPDGSEVLVTRCDGTSDGGCRAERHAVADRSLLGELPGLAGKRARYSPEGHWVVADNELFHIPAMRLRQYTASPGPAAFVVNGDIIAGEADGSLVRYCRSSE